MSTYAATVSLAESFTLQCLNVVVPLHVPSVNQIANITRDDQHVGRECLRHDRLPITAELL